MVSFFAAGPFSPLCLVISFYAVAVLILDLFVQNDCPKFVQKNLNFPQLRSKRSALRHDVLLNLSCGSCGSGCSSSGCCCGGGGCCCGGGCCGCCGSGCITSFLGSVHVVTEQF